MIEFAHPTITSAEIEAVAAVMRTAQLAQGKEVAGFEEEFAAEIGSQHAVAVSNGTTAIEIGLQALGIGPGDEVIVPSFTFIATANAVRRVGATPVFADIDPKTYCINAATVEPLRTDRTRAVIAVHLYGHPADMDGLIALCAANNLHLIEDAAQAIGVSWSGQKAGSFGSFATFSLYATKNIVTGEGGMITTSDAAIADVSRSLRQHQSRMVNGVLQVASNARMTDVEAAIGRVQLGRLPEIQTRRTELAHRYTHGLSDAVTAPYVADGAVHGYHQYTIRVSDRERLTSHLAESGVGFGIYYPTPAHLADTYRDQGIRLPETELASSQVMSLPIRPDLTDEEQEQVINAINRGVGA